MSGFACAATPAVLAAALGMSLAIGAIALPAIWRRGPGRRGRRLAALAAALLGLLGLVAQPRGAIPAAGSGRAVLLTPDEAEGGNAAAGQGEGSGNHSLRVAHSDASGTNRGTATGRDDGAGRDDGTGREHSVGEEPGAGRERGVGREHGVSWEHGAGGEEDAAWEHGAGWEVLPDARTLWRREPWLRRLEVRGYGLDAADFAGFTGAIDRFAPPALPAGVMAALWPRRVPLGAPLWVQLRAAPATAGRVDLIGPGGVEAGADAAAARRGATLTVRPKAAGRLLYRLVARDAAGGEIAGEPLDVAVEPAQPPRVLALFAAPSFENRALLRFLAGAGVPFVASLELTRGRAHVEASWPPAFGPPPSTAPPLGAATALARCDVLLVDGRAWKALSPGERAAVAAAVASGLGVLLFDADPAQGEEDGFPVRSRSLAGAPGVAATGAPAAQAGTSAAPAISTAAASAGTSMAPATSTAPAASEASGASGTAAGREARLAWPGQEPLSALTLPSREIAPAAGEEPLISSLEGHVVAARRRRGRGAVALSVVEESFPWALGADRQSYEAFWARLLGAVARADAAPSFVLPGGPILVDRPLDVTLLSPTPAGGKAPRVELLEGESTSPLPLFAVGPGRFASRLWPRHEGWLRLVSTDGASAWLHAAGPRSWRTWQKAERIAATAATAARAAQPAAAEPDQPGSTLRPWPRLPFYLLFLAGAGWLWFEERVRTSHPPERAI
jgi:hypothetical protein